MSMIIFILYHFLIILIIVNQNKIYSISNGNLCSTLNNCNNHGYCDTIFKKCNCFAGWGAATDISVLKSPDCSQRVCPSGPAWADIPSSATKAHAKMECSGAGLCDRLTGMCVCFAGFTGVACSRTTCPRDCSGHGVCTSMRKMATMSNALPLSAVTTYDGDILTTTWDKDRIYGCVCDSSWPVGLGNGETQTPEWFGADCSKKHCPSGKDPLSPIDETDCSGVVAAGGFGTGMPGNKCHVDCSNRGICDYTTGLCKCFTGFYGKSCANINPL